MDIYGIGTDMVEVERIKNAIKSDHFKKKYFTYKEIELINKRGDLVAATNFCGKEAISKAFGTGVRGFSLIDIEILRNDLGKPYVILNNNIKKISESLNIKKIDISLSNCKNYAIAFSIITR